MGEGILTVVIGGFFVLILLAVVLGLAGFVRHDTFRVWLALAVVWVPALFIYGARNSN